MQYLRNFRRLDIVFVIFFLSNSRHIVRSRFERRRYVFRNHDDGRRYARHLYDVDRLGL